MSYCQNNITAEYDEKREEGPARAARDGDIVPADVQAEAGRRQERRQDGLQPQVRNLYNNDRLHVSRIKVQFGRIMVQFLATYALILVSLLHDMLYPGWG